LGNPGDRYAHTRHNIGFDVAAELIRRRGRGGWIERPACELAVVTPGRMVVVARPLLFMNRSGEVAGPLLDELEIEPERMLVVVDDVDLPLGSLRLRASGGPGTHNGLRDLCARVGRSFPRLRVGVRGEKIEGDLADYVTGDFCDDEVEVARAAVDRAADAIDCALANGFERAMNTFNRSS
jgi:PTH1 family peptidyl-tRNA hydrolase